MGSSPSVPDSFEHACPLCLPLRPPGRWPRVILAATASPLARWWTTLSGFSCALELPTAGVYSALSLPGLTGCSSPPPGS